MPLRREKQLLWYDCVSVIDNGQKLRELQAKLAHYKAKLAQKMKRYRGVIHESGLSEMRHNEVMVLRAIIADLKREIQAITDT